MSINDHRTTKAPLTTSCATCGRTLRIMVPLADAIAVTQRDIHHRDVEGMTTEFLRMATAPRLPFSGECDQCTYPCLPVEFDGVTIEVSVTAGFYGEVERLTYTYEAHTTKRLLDIVQGTIDSFADTTANPWISCITLTARSEIGLFDNHGVYQYPGKAARRLIEELTPTAAIPQPVRY